MMHLMSPITGAPGSRSDESSRTAKGRSASLMFGRAQRAYLSLYLASRMHVYATYKRVAGGGYARCVRTRVFPLFSLPVARPLALLRYASKAAPLFIPS